jgi:hypothetical protein
MPRFELWRNLVLSRTNGGVARSTAALTRTAHHRPVVVFLRQLGEMTLAMFVGMFGFGLALGVAAGRKCGAAPRRLGTTVAGVVRQVVMTILPRARPSLR